VYAFRILPGESTTLYKVNSTAAIAQPPGSIFAPSSAKRPQIFLNNQFHFPINYAKCF
jgi:hypothetical protein